MYLNIMKQMKRERKFSQNFSCMYVDAVLLKISCIVSRSNRENLERIKNFQKNNIIKLQKMYGLKNISNELFKCKQLPLLHD